jgi:hypothetical protein
MPLWLCYGCGGDGGAAGAEEKGIPPTLTLTKISTSTSSSTHTHVTVFAACTSFGSCGRRTK